MTLSRTMDQALETTTNPAWCLYQEGFDPLRDGSRESRFSISNGFLGVRGGRTIDRLPNGIVAPRTYVAGLFDVVGCELPIPTLVPAPDWLRVDLSLCNAPSKATVDVATFHHRTLDFHRGVLVTEATMADASGLAIRLRVLRLVSLDERALGLQLIQLDVTGEACEATLHASFEGLDLGLSPEVLDPDLVTWRTRASGKRLSIASGATLRVDGRVIEPNATAPFDETWTWLTRPGQTVCFERMVAITREDAPAGVSGEGARRALEGARSCGWDELLARHEAAWARRWADSDVVVEGDAGAQQALRFALYHLNGAANPADNRVSIAARALTGPGYHGHVFWDTEIFLLPFYTLTWPEAARALLLYRFRTLDAARAKATRLGWRGALYAWESADTGAETTPEHAIGPDRHVVNILCGVQEQHISADVAYAVWHYWKATEDDAFLEQAGAEILLETARFWASRAEREADDRCHIRGVIGPDEYHETVDDNAFTNVMARWNIRRALEIAVLLRTRWPETWTALSGRIGLDGAELTRWAAAADTIETGLDPETGLFDQFSGFLKLDDIDLTAYAGRSVPMDVVLGRERMKTVQVIKQADVVALLALLPEEFPDGSASVNFDYYEPRCSHGSSLSAAMHGLAAARLGRSEAALRFFRQASATDLADTHAAIDGGIHIAALGGVWMVAVLGFAGLSMVDDGIRLAPNLPAGWSSLTFAIQWRGRHLSIGIDRAGQTVSATLLSGDAMTVTVGSERHRLGPGLQLLVGVDASSAPSSKATGPLERTKAAPA